MDVETSLSWRGPYWYAGRRPRRSSSGDAPEDLDVSLLNMFERGSRLPLALPAAIVVDVAQVEADQLEALFDWLMPQIRNLGCEVPFYLLTGSDDLLPDGLQPTAVIDRIVPDEVLLMLICIHQRALLRSEEAQLRRRVFGRIPGFGSAPHHSGSSSLLVVGLSGRFLEWQDASDQKVEVVGAFDGNMAVEFMSKRAFDAVVIDAPFDDAIDYMQQIRRDARFAGLPVLAVCEREEDLVLLFRNGASDVLVGENRKETLVKRLNAAIRFGKRRRLADRVLAESHMWLRQQVTSGGLGSKNTPIIWKPAAMPWQPGDWIFGDATAAGEFRHRSQFSGGAGGDQRHLAVDCRCHQPRRGSGLSGARCRAGGRVEERGRNHAPTETDQFDSDPYRALN